jgi:hypothetical protein
MAILAELVDLVIGVDTHKHTPPPRSSRQSAARSLTR